MLHGHRFGRVRSKASSSATGGRLDGGPWADGRGKHPHSLSPSATPIGAACVWRTGSSKLQANKVNEKKSNKNNIKIQIGSESDPAISALPAEAARQNPPGAAVSKDPIPTGPQIACPIFQSAQKTGAPGAVSLPHELDKFHQKEELREFWAGFPEPCATAIPKAIFAQRSALSTH
ncbi:MAG: hypothetical protein KGS44_00710 [Alphaproteobacteria bacterium]|nr:hypothetical protein [Alphaproteobacteria bacterium]